MKEMIRMGVILMIFCVVAAVALAFTNQVTSVVIAERLHQEKVAQLAELFPTLTNFEERTVDGRTATVAFDAENKFVGVLAEGQTEGYGGPIRFNLGINAAGEIVGLTVFAQTETPGLGDKIKEPWFTEQFLGKKAGDTFTVDAISGATVSVRAMETGVEREYNEIWQRFSDGGVAGAEGNTAPAFSLEGVADGTYTGTAKGFKGDITLEVTVAGGKITAINVTAQQETADRWANAEKVIEEIIAKQTIQVDAVSGATISSDAIIKAVQNALEQ
ncbi:MAG: FMN-binding protein [Clostridium sp.]|nr:FMN-binding protein [Clostridium sp.]